MVATTCANDSAQATYSATATSAWLMMLRTGVTMTIPHFISEDKSDIWAVKHGWYAVDDNGRLCSGPFASQDECLRAIAQPTNGSVPSRSRGRLN
jgi:hypothetical protein